MTTEQIKAGLEKLRREPADEAKRQRLLEASNRSCGFADHATAHALRAADFEQDVAVLDAALSRLGEPSVQQTQEIEALEAENVRLRCERSAERAEAECARLRHESSAYIAGYNAALSEMGAVSERLKLNAAPSDLEEQR